jgi:adenylate kinase family enzyme
MSLALEDAAARLATARRVLVIGCSGSGKSTLSRALAARLGLRHVSMDREIFWLPGWQERPRDEALARLASVLAEENWIIDGTSPGTLHMRLPRTHLVIWMRPSRWTSLRGSFGRLRTYWGRTRPDMADNCPEKMDFEFLHYIWTFERLATPKILRELAAHGQGVPLLILRSREEANRLVASLAGHSAN